MAGKIDVVLESLPCNSRGVARTPGNGQNECMLIHVTITDTVLCQLPEFGRGGKCQACPITFPPCVTCKFQGRTGRADVLTATGIQSQDLVTSSPTRIRLRRWSWW